MRGASTMGAEALVDAAACVDGLPSHPINVPEMAATASRTVIFMVSRLPGDPAVIIVTAC